MSDKSAFERMQERKHNIDESQPITENIRLFQKLQAAEARAEQAEAKLAKAVETLWFYASEEPWSRNAIEGNHGDWGKRARKTLADLKGE